MSLRGEADRDEERMSDRDRGLSRNIDYVMEGLLREQEARDKRSSVCENRRVDRRAQGTGRDAMVEDEEEWEEEYVILDLDDVFHGAPVSNYTYTLSIFTQSSGAAAGPGYIESDTDSRLWAEAGKIGQYVETIGTVVVYSEKENEVSEALDDPPGVPTSADSNAVNKENKSLKRIRGVCKLERKLKFSALPLDVASLNHATPMMGASLKTTVPLVNASLNNAMQVEDASLKNPMPGEDASLENVMPTEDVSLKNDMQVEDASLKIPTPREDALVENVLPTDDLSLKNDMQREDASLEISTSREDASVENVMPMEDASLKNLMQVEDASLEISTSREDASVKNVIPMEDASLKNLMQVEDASFENAQEAVDAPIKNILQAEDEVMENAMLTEDATSKNAI